MAPEGKIEGAQRKGDGGTAKPTESSPLIAKQGTTYVHGPKLPHPKYQAASTTYDSESEETAIINNSDLLTSFYEMRDIRVPDPMFGLDFYYCFYLLVGVYIGSVKEDKYRLITGVENIDDDNEDMMKVGPAPSPQSRQPFVWVFSLFRKKVQLVIHCFSVFCLLFYASIHFAHALKTDLPFLRTLFVVFEVCAVVASLALASEILTKRLIGTRIFYTLNSYANEKRRHKLKHQMGWALAACVGLNLILPCIGILDDLVITTNRPTVADLTFLSDYHVMLLPLWEATCVIINLQLVCGVTVFAGISSIYLVRINSCLQLLKQPKTTVRDCFAELLDLDVSLSDLSSMLDFRLSVMLITSFLTFFFQSIFLSNTGVDFSEGIEAVLSFAHPALICFVILGTTGALNANIKRLKLVARRFSAFKEKLAQDRKRKDKKEKKQKAKLEALKHDTPKQGVTAQEEANPTLVNLIAHDEATSGHEDLFDSELATLKDYLKESVIGISLLGFQLDESFTWGFLVLSMSSVMSLTNLDKLSFL